MNEKPYNQDAPTPVPSFESYTLPHSHTEQEAQQLIDTAEKRRAAGIPLTKKQKIAIEIYDRVKKQEQEKINDAKY